MMNPDERDSQGSAFQGWTEDQLERRIDRLVDGELSPGEYRELVLRLDRDPRHWRQVGLAFLEWQALERELRAISGGTPPQIATPTPSSDFADECVTAQTTVNSRHEDERQASWSGWIVASLAGLAVGWVVFGQAPNHSGPVQREAAPQIANDATSEGSPENVDGWRMEASEAESRDRSFDQLARYRSGASENSTIGPPTVFIQNGELTSDGQLKLPVGATDGELPESALSAELLSRIRASGRQVERSWQYQPVRLPSGEQIVVPVERVRLRPVSNLLIP